MLYLLVCSIGSYEDETEWTEVQSIEQMMAPVVKRDRICDCDYVAAYPLSAEETAKFTALKEASFAAQMAFEEYTRSIVRR